MINTFVVSSNIQRIGWKLNVLYIQFNSGDCYSYDGVDYQTYEQMAEADSVGSFFHRFVRSRFNYVKLLTNPFESSDSVMKLTYNSSYITSVSAGIHQ